jgi:hypothetical protein
MWVSNGIGSITIPTEVVPVLGSLVGITVLALQSWQLATIYSLGNRVTRLEATLGTLCRKFETEFLRK